MGNTMNTVRTKKCFLKGTMVVLKADIGNFVSSYINIGKYKNISET